MEVDAKAMQCAIRPETVPGSELESAVDRLFPQLLIEHASLVSMTDKRPASGCSLELARFFGRHGVSDVRLGKALDEREIIGEWLTHFSAKPATFASYRREAERLYYWALLQRRKLPTELNGTDLAAYAAFLANPQPAALWITARAMRVSRHRSEWRPFAGRLSVGSIRQALAIVHRLFDWFAGAGILLRDPLRAETRACNAQGNATTDALATASCQQHDQLQRQVAIALDGLPRDTPRDAEHGERIRWLFALMHYGELSINEIANHTTDIFYTRAVGDSTEWWLRLDTRCGERSCRPAPPKLVAALERYRRALGLAALPERHEGAPLIYPIGGRRCALKPRVLYQIAHTLAHALIATIDSPLTGMATKAVVALLCRRHASRSTAPQGVGLAVMGHKAPGAQRRDRHQARVLARGAVALRNSVAA